MNSKKIIKINFSDFWPDFDVSNNHICDLLSKEYQIEISENPDFLIYSVFGYNYRRYNCCRIFYTGENVVPDFMECDYALSFCYLNERPNHYRLPYYYTTLHNNSKSLIRPIEQIEDIIRQKSKFCNFVYSNGNAKERVHFFNKLSKYKKVDSGGKYMNNIGGPVADKLAFISQYKFTIAFENWSTPGYTTEKIVEPMLMHSIPIYWGNPEIHKEFNPKSFINIHDFASEEDAIERIIEIDQNDELFRQYLEEPCFHHNIYPKELESDNICRFFTQIFDHPPSIPVAKTWRSHYYYVKRAKKRILYWIYRLKKWLKLIDY